MVDGQPPIFHTRGLPEQKGSRGRLLNRGTGHAQQNRSPEPRPSPVRYIYTSRENSLEVALCSKVCRET